jgi:iron complex outermembrane receptor protein
MVGIDDPWESAGSAGTFQFRRNYGFTGRAEYDAGGAVFTSLTSYRKNFSSAAADYVGLAPGFPFTTDVNYQDRSSQFTQELRVNSAAGSGLQWVGGLFFYRDHIERAERFVVTVATPPFPPGLAGDTRAAQDGRNKSYAAFGQVTLPFASIWELTIGGRITHDRKRVFQSAFRNVPAPSLGFPLFPGQPYAVPAGRNFTKPTWRVSLAVEPSPGKRFYASYDRGYKSGSFTSQAQTAAQAQFSVDPEKLDSFNVGMKTQWLNNSLRLNADAYYLDYKKLQVFEFGANFASVLANANATVKGVEIQALAAPSRNFSFGTNFAYMDGKIKSNPSFAGVVLPYKGNDLPRAPKYKISTFAQVNFDLLGGELDGRVSYDLQDSFFYNPSNDPASQQESYGLLNARIAWESADQLKFALSADNLTNTRYSVHNISFQGLGLRIFGPPRAFTFAVQKRF